MEIGELLEKRLQELVILTNKLSSQNSEFKDVHLKLMDEIKKSGNSEEEKLENRKKTLEIKKISTFALLRTNEIGVNIRVMNEIYSVLKFMGIVPNISDEDLKVIEFNFQSVKPTYILDKGELSFFDTSMLDFILTKIEEPDDKLDLYINNIKKLGE